MIIEKRAGYKQTDIGIFPNDWKVDEIGNVCDIHDSMRIPLSSVQRRNRKGPYPYYGANNIQDSIDNYIFDFDSVLLAEDGGYYEEYDSRDIAQFATGKYWVNNHAHILTGRDCLDSQFLYYTLVRKNICPWINTGTRAKLNQGDLRKIKIAFPPLLSEQKKIATVLSDVDKLIESIEFLIAKKSDMKTAVMQQLLTGRERLPGFNGAWTEKNMAQDSYLKARIGWQGLTTVEYLETGKYILITGTDFQNGKLDWDNCCYVEQERYDQDKNIQVNLGDILLTKDGTIGKVAYVDKLPKPATLNSGVFVIRPINESYHPLYFYYVLRSKIFKDFLNKLQAGSTINHLYQKDFVHFLFNAPPVPEQRAISQILYDIDLEIESLEHHLYKTVNLKTGMMQQLLSGKTRLCEKNYEEFTL